MTRPYIPQTLRQKVAEDAMHRCGYCLTIQEFTAMPMQIEHIIPISSGGNSSEDNLWLSCPVCNGHKATKTSAIDPVSNREVPLFHPRRQTWEDHFEWSEDGIEIVGRTDIGRATVQALQVNNPNFLRARKRWVLAGWHPPK